MEYKYIYFSITDFVTAKCIEKSLKDFPADTYPTFPIAYHAIIRTELLNYFTIQMPVFLQNFSFFAC